MGRTLLIALALATLVGFTAPVARQAADDQELAGVYMCDGVSPEGSAYRAIVEIDRFHDTYRVRWTFPQEKQSLGIGIVSGKTFAVSYYGSGMAGVVVYKIEEGPRGNKLVGEWAVAGADGSVYAETLTRMPGRQAPSVDDPQPEPRDRREARPRRAPAASGPVVGI